MPELQARASGRNALKMVGLAVLIVAWNGVLWVVDREVNLFFVFLAAVLVVAAATALDRRVKLTVSELGIHYVPWGDATFRWDEFQGFSLHRVQRQVFIALQPTWPEPFHEKLSIPGRLRTRTNRWIGAPAISISAGALDAPTETILGALAARLPETRSDD